MEETQRDVKRLNRPDFLAIGHLTKDLQDGGYTIGGAVTFASLTARNLGLRAAVVTRASPDLDLYPLFQGIEVLSLPSEATTTFKNVYFGEMRVQYIGAVADRIEAEDIPPGWREARIVYLAPLAGELGADIVHLFPHSLLGVSPQGWLRRWDEEGRVYPKTWDGAEEGLSRADAVILSEEDVGGDEGTILDYASQARILVVTQGSKGATVYQGGEARRLPAFKVKEVVDPTGAGDIFAAAYLIELERSGDPYRAAVFANCVASISVEKRGTAEIPTLEEVKERLAEIGWQ